MSTPFDAIRADRDAQRVLGRAVLPMLARAFVVGLVVGVAVGLGLAWLL